MQDVDRNLARKAFQRQSAAMVLPGTICTESVGCQDFLPLEAQAGGLSRTMASSVS